MSYAARIDEMIGKHVAELQLELSLAKTIGACLRRFRPMPYGYPLRVWSPHHIGPFPRSRNPIAHKWGTRTSASPQKEYMESFFGQTRGFTP